MRRPWIHSLESKHSTKARRYNHDKEKLELIKLHFNVLWWFSQTVCGRFFVVMVSKTPWDEGNNRIPTECTQPWNIVKERDKQNVIWIQGKNWTIKSSHVKPFPITLVDKSNHWPVSCPRACRPAGPWCSAKHQSAYMSSTGRHQAAPGARNR